MSDQPKARKENASAKRKSPGYKLYWILLLPFIATLFPPFFNFREPAIAGVPFFYWYQFLWIPVTSFLIWIIYRRQR